MRSTSDARALQRMTTPSSERAASALGGAVLRTAAAAVRLLRVHVSLFTSLPSCHSRIHKKSRGPLSGMHAHVSCCSVSGNMSF